MCYFTQMQCQIFDKNTVIIVNKTDKGSLSAHFEMVIDRYDFQ